MSYTRKSFELEFTLFVFALCVLMVACVLLTPRRQYSKADEDAYYYVYPTIYTGE